MALEYVRVGLSRVVLGPNRPFVAVLNGGSVAAFNRLLSRICSLSQLSDDFSIGRTPIASYGHLRWRCGDHIWARSRPAAEGRFYALTACFDFWACALGLGVQLQTKFKLCVFS